MSLTDSRKEIEIERVVARQYLQLLSKAEALVPGAGRDAVVPLLWDASAVVVRIDVQNDRVVLDGTLNCQAVYRQGEEGTLRALGAKTAIGQAIDVPQAQPGMVPRAEVQVEHVEVRYENGHMVFLVGLGIHIWVIQLEHIEAITEVGEDVNTETKFIETEFVKLAADSGETAVMTAEVELPHSLDARNTLMDWGIAMVDSVQPDLGGVRVKGRAMIETLVSSGIEGRPEVVVKYPMEFDKLVELPEWLAINADVSARLRNIRTQVERQDDGEEGKLMIQCDVHFHISSNVHEKIKLLTDAYSTADEKIILKTETTEACTGIVSGQSIETIRGTVITEEGSSAIGSVIAVHALPNIAEISCGKDSSRITGIMESDVLYMPAGSDQPETTHTELPFEVEIARPLDENSLIRMNVITAEANALMSDRLEMKIAVCIDYENRKYNAQSFAADMEVVEAKKRKSGYIICWPSEDDDEWTLGKRYAISADGIKKAAGAGGITAGKCIVLNG